MKNLDNPMWGHFYSSIAFEVTRDFHGVFDGFLRMHVEDLATPQGHNVLKASGVPRSGNGSLASISPTCMDVNTPMRLTNIAYWTTQWSNTFGGDFYSSLMSANFT